MLKELLHKLVDGVDLSEGEMVDAMEAIMGGEATHAQMAAFLTALRVKGETVEEIAGSGRLPFQRGFAYLYAKSGAEIVPVVHNAGLCWPEGFRIKRPGVVTLRYCEPIPTGRDPTAVAAEIETILNREKDRLLSPGVVV